ncbi:unnamed protein product [Bemisia tabaci]|uniref:Cytochrome c oxidase assembly protein COX15 n=1 Tax=Bemisia tabaci TaxID=7038 RepID=A0A9P0A189_BEMTA|nr:PREDICTED: cytochrome c oxidase assembly protein COX15 homolog [Bemisia tabaci]CAH0382201.1 unnamed protein product [Bemisia tabaci]
MLAYKITSRLCPCSLAHSHCAPVQVSLFSSNLVRRNNFRGLSSRKILPSLLSRFKVPAFVRKLETVAVDSISCSIPTRGSKAVGFWLAGCSGMVFGAVALGGVTRLTESGLSMVSWKLTGEKLPLTEVEWKSEFEKYQEYPEFKLKNQNISLAEFKWIWYMEYGHRMWGRLLGAVFLIPATYFWSRGYFNSSLKRRTIIFTSLIGAQGLLGWYMVKSGLEDRFHEPSDVPRVSQYRLAAHLTMAFTLYSLFLWSTLDQLLPSMSFKEISPSLRKLRAVTHSTKGLVFLTAISGAFVAGLDAGLVYNSFPKMADRWIPQDLFAFSPILRNFTENPTTTQFVHRILGISTLSVASGMWLLSRRCHLPHRAALAANAVAAVAWFQVALGITTLLLYVPVPVAALHQSNSLILLSCAIWLSHELKNVKRIIK